MSPGETLTEKEIHEKLAKSLFNLTWDLLDKEERTQEENDQMIQAAHASRYHWGVIGTPLEFERGEWQISRVYSVLGHSQAAIYHAERCLAICQEHEITDFDLAFAYEGLARGYATAGDITRSQEYLELAAKAAQAIKDEGNREYVKGELKSIRAHQT